MRSRFILGCNVCEVFEMLQLKQSTKHIHLHFHAVFNNYNTRPFQCQIKMYLTVLHTWILNAERCFRYLHLDKFIRNSSVHTIEN